MGTLYDAFEPARPMREGEIPIIDFTPFLAGNAADKAAVAAAIGKACEQVGFFYLTGTGVPQTEIDRVFAESRRFFAQSPADKARSAATWDWYRGWVPPKEVGEDGRPGGVSEVYRLMLDLPEDDPDVVAGKPLHLPNRWPDHLPGFRETVGGYVDTLLDVGAQVRRAFALAPENVQVRISYAFALANKGDFDPAIKLAQSIAFDPHMGAQGRSLLRRLESMRDGGSGDDPDEEEAIKDASDAEGAAQ